MNTTNYEEHQRSVARMAQQQKALHDFASQQKVPQEVVEQQKALHEIAEQQKALQEVVEQQKALQEIAEQHRRIKEMEDHLKTAVFRARQLGRSWTEVGQAIGESKQTAFNRYSTYCAERSAHAQDDGI